MGAGKRLKGCAQQAPAGMSVISHIDEELGVLEKVKSGMAAARQRFEEREGAPRSGHLHTGHLHTATGSPAAGGELPVPGSPYTLVSPARSVGKVCSPAGAHGVAEDSLERIKLLEASIRYEAGRHRELEALGQQALRSQSDAAAKTTRAGSPSPLAASMSNESVGRPFLGE